VPHAPVPGWRPDSRTLIAVSLAISLALMTIGLAANEDSTQERIHRALSWSVDPGHCAPWSLTWLLLGLALAAAAFAIAHFARRSSVGETGSVQTASLVALAAGMIAVAYWIANTVGALGTRCTA
jgi:hypothetical protein